MALRRLDPARPRTLVGSPTEEVPRTLLSERPPREPKIDDRELESLRQADREIDAAMHPLNERGKRRWKIHVLGSVVFFPLITWFLTPAGFDGLWLQLIVAAAYGTFIAFARPAGITASVVTLLAGLMTQVIAGTPTNHFSGLLFTLGLFMYATLGFILGMTQEAAYMNGE